MDRARDRLRARFLLRHVLSGIPNRGASRRKVGLVAVSDLEAALEFHLRREKISGYVREHRYHDDRRWRFDFAWPNAKVAVEVDGGIYGPKAGRHNRGAGMEADNEKLNTAASMGWVILRFGPRAINSGDAVEVIKTALEYWSKDDGRAIC